MRPRPEHRGGIEAQLTELLFSPQPLLPAGTALERDDPAAGAADLESAVRIFEQIGRTTSSGAVWSRRPGCDSERTTARARANWLQRALALFEECGTVDEPARVRALLERGPARCPPLRGQRFCGPRDAAGPLLGQLADDPGERGVRQA